MRKFIIRVMLFSLSCFVFLELVFRFVLPACEAPSTIQINPGGYLVSDTGYQKSGYYTIGRIPSVRSHWVLNNAGYNSLFNFEPARNRNRPLIALIGDCTLESLSSNVEEHIDTWLFDILDGKFDIYAFGRQGQPLVQMMLLMERIDSLYRPDIYIIIFNGTPLLGSIMPDNRVEYNYLSPTDSVFVIRTPSIREPSEFARTAMRSAFIRYIRLNMNVDIFPLTNVTSIAHNYNAGLSADKFLKLMPKAGTFLLNRMSVLLGERRLLIVGDDPGDRSRRYDSLSAEVDFTIDYDMMPVLCAGFRNIDYLNPISSFQTDYDTMGVLFESPDGRHLNGHGNYVMASAISGHLRASGILERILADRRPEEENSGSNLDRGIR